MRSEGVNANTGQDSNLVGADLVVNDGQFGAQERSAFGLGDMMMWSRLLSDDEMMTVAGYLIDKQQV